MPIRVSIPRWRPFLCQKRTATPAREMNGRFRLEVRRAHRFRPGCTNGGTKQESAYDEHENNSFVRYLRSRDGISVPHNTRSQHILFSITVFLHQRRIVTGPLPRTDFKEPRGVLPVVPIPYIRRPFCGNADCRKDRVPVPGFQTYRFIFRYTNNGMSSPCQQ